MPQTEPKPHQHEHLREDLSLHPSRRLFAHYQSRILNSALHQPSAKRGAISGLYKPILTALAPANPNGNGFAGTFIDKVTTPWHGKKDRLPLAASPGACG